MTTSRSLRVPRYFLVSELSLWNKLVVDRLAGGKAHKVAMCVYMGVIHGRLKEGTDG